MYLYPPQVWFQQIQVQCGKIVPVVYLYKILGLTNVLSGEQCLDDTEPYMIEYVISL
jgi:hypothetical protein